MSEDVKTLSFDELDDRLQEKVKKHFSESEYLISEDWYEFVVDSIVEKYNGILDINPTSIQYDMDRNTFSWKGTVETSHPVIAALIPSRVKEYLENGYLVEFSEAFTDGAMVGEYEVDYRVITDIEPVDIMPADFSSKYGVIAKLEDVEVYKALVETYSIDDPEIIGYITGWLALFEAAPLFFQNEAHIDVEEYNEVADYILYDGEYANKLIKKIEIYMETEAFNDLSDYVSDAFNEFTKAMRDSYDYYFTDEYILSEVGEKTFKVTFDEDGEQDHIDNLDGEW